MPNPHIETNKEIVRRYYEFLNDGDPAILDEIISPNYIEHNPEGPESLTIQALKERATLERKGVPGLRIEIEREIGEGDYVVVAWRAAGIQTAEFMGIAVTGKYASVTGITIARVIDGKITEMRSEWDKLGLLQQLGVIPSE